MKKEYKVWNKVTKLRTIEESPAVKFFVKGELKGRKEIERYTIAELKKLIDKDGLYTAKEV